MVSADNLNLDVLEMIFAYLSGKDLASVALVSRSFLAGVIPRLYCSLLFRLSQGKKYPQAGTPFNSILLHPHLAVHVRRVDIRYIPTCLSAQPHPDFLRDCARALTLCTNLSSFRYSGNYLPSFLLSLENKSRLQDLRVNANLTSTQSAKLAELPRLRSLILENASWSAVDVLPKWMTSIKKTLTSLTLYATTELNECVLDSVLTQLPQLRSLHVVGCPKIGHVTMFRLLKHTPRLESLSLSIWETSKPLGMPPPSLCHLRHLACDIRYVLIPSPAPSVLNIILTHIKPSCPPLSSFVLKFCDRSFLVENPFIQDLLQNHSGTLTKVAFINCMLSIESITAICRQSINLEKLEVAIPVNSATAFGNALAHSTTLQTVIDKGDTHATHGPQATLGRDSIYSIMLRVTSLKKIVTENRVWTICRAVDHDHIFLERKMPFQRNPWFMPSD